MATTSHRPVATRTVAIGLLLIAACVAVWIVFVRTDEQQRTVVRLTQPVAAGEYLTGADIEAIQLTVDSNVRLDYVTTGQARSGLIAAHDLAAGDVLLVSSVYTTGQQPAPDLHANTTASGVRALDLLALAVGTIGILGVVVGVGRRRPSGRQSRQSPASVPLDRSPGWLHVEVNTWIAEDGDWNQRPAARRAAAMSGTPVEPGAGHRAPAVPKGTNLARPHGALDVDQSELRDTKALGGDGTAEVTEADTNAVPVPPAGTLEALPTEAAPHQADPAEVASHNVFRPAPTDIDCSMQQTPTEFPTADESGLDSGQPLALLQVFGDVKVHGVPVSQAAAAPFILAAAGRPMSTDELVELTGYAAKTFSSVYPASHPIVTRTNGMLTLAPGVWTDHSWLAETVRRAAGALRNEQNAKTAEWLRQAFDLASRIDGAPFERVPRSRREVIHGRRRDPWAWVDEFPYTMNARVHAGQEVVEAALAATALWQVVEAHDVLSSEIVVDVLCKLAKLLPDVPVARTVRPTQWQTGAPCLLLAAIEVADSRELTRQVHATAQRLVADQIIEADPDLADDLGM